MSNRITFCCHSNWVVLIKVKNPTAVVPSPTFIDVKTAFCKTAVFSPADVYLLMGIHLFTVASVVRSIHDM